MKSYNISSEFKKPVTGHYETDLFYFDSNGDYKYSPDLSHAASIWCLRNVETSMKSNHNLIVVSNNFTRLWELEPYTQLAVVYGYEIQEVICKGNFKSSHISDPAAIARMKKFFQYRPLEYLVGTHAE